jgi:hypothetical protein
MTVTTIRECGTLISRATAAQRHLAWVFLMVGAMRVCLHAACAGSLVVFAPLSYQTEELRGVARDSTTSISKRPTVYF